MTNNNFKWTNRKGAIIEGAKLMKEKGYDHKVAAVIVLGMENENYKSDFCVNSPWISVKAQSQLERDIMQEWLNIHDK